MIRLNEFMGKDNEHIFTEITGVSIIESENKFINNEQFNTDNLDNLKLSLKNVLVNKTSKVMLIRIWGNLNTGEYPPYSNDKSFPKFGYEDFLFNINDWSFKRFSLKNHWRERRTPFPFDCLMYFDKRGMVATIDEKFQKILLLYQFGKSKLKWQQNNYRHEKLFDKSLNVFYSKSSYLSCFNLENFTAFLTFKNVLHVVDQRYFNVSFENNSSTVKKYVKINLCDFICKHKLNPLFYQNLSKLVESTFMMEENENRKHTYTSDVMQNTTILNSSNQLLNRVLFFLLVVCIVFFISSVVASLSCCIQTSNYPTQLETVIKDNLPQKQIQSQVKYKI